MSDDKKDNVVEGLFGSKEEEAPSASTMFGILHEELDGEDDGVETVLIMFKEGQPTALMGNVGLDRAAMLLLMGQVALTDTIMGGYDDETLH